MQGGRGLMKHLINILQMKNLQKLWNMPKTKNVIPKIFLEDGRFVISNNLCEAHIRPFTNGVLYTLVETAKQNDLNIFNYLDYLLKSLPNIDFPKYSELLDDYLPWSEQLPEECRLTIRNKKRFKR